MKRSLRLEVRSGTVTGFSSSGFFDTVKNKNATWVEHGETVRTEVKLGKPNKNGVSKETKKEITKKTVSLLNKNAVKGMLYKLTGHIDKIDVCDEFSPLSKLINNMTFKVKPLHSKAALTSVGQKFKTGDAEVPSVKLSQYSLNDLSDNLMVYRKEILELTGKQDLGSLEDMLYPGKETEQPNVPRLNQMKKEINSLLKSFPDSKLFNKISTDLGDKIEGKKVTGGWSTNESMMDLLTLVTTRVKNDNKFLEEVLRVSKSKGTFFEQTSKRWIKNIPTVIQGVEYGYKIDFDILFNDVPEEILEAIENGPDQASWAKRGLVTPFINNYPNLYTDNDGLSDKLVVICGWGEIV